MATLTWRDVAPPDFRGATQGVQTAAQLLGNATTAASQGLDAFQKAQADQAGTQAILQTMAQQNPQGYAAMMSGVDPSQLNQSAVEALLKSQGTMATTGRANAAAGLDRQTTLDKTVAAGRLARDNQSRDAARVPQALMADAMMRGDTGAMQQLYQQYGATIGQMPVDDQQKMLQGLSTFGTGSQKLNQTVADEKQKDMANNLTAQIRQTALTPEQQELMINQYGASQGADPAVYNELVKTFSMPQGGGSSSGGSTGKGTAAGGAGVNISGLTSGGAGGTGNSPYNTVVGHGAFGKPPKNVSDMTLDETIAYGKDTLIPATRNNAQLGLSGTGKGTSAMGAYQFTGETLAQYGPKVLGPTWRSEKMTPENQDKLAEALFNDRKGGNLKDTWAALPDATPGAYKDTSWKDMKGIISQRETGMSVNDSAKVNNKSAADTKFYSELQDDQLTRIASENKAQGVTARLLETRKDNSDIATVTQGLMDKGSVYSGLRPDDVARELREIMKETGENAATAAELMKRNYSGNTSMFRVLGNFNPFSREGARITNMDGVAKDIEGLRTGNADLKVAQVKQQEREQKELSDATSAYDKSRKTRMAAEKKVESQPGARASLEALYQDEREKLNELQSLQAKAADRIADSRGPDRPTVGQAGAPAATAMVSDARIARDKAQTAFDEYVAKNEGKPVQNDSAYQRLRAEVLRANRQFQNARIDARK